MNRSGLVLSGILAAVGTARIIFPEQVLQIFSLDASVAVLALVTAVLAYGIWFGPLNFLSGSRLLRLLGFAVLVAGIMSINYPTLFGFRHTYLPIVDIFMFVESGIILQLIGLERKADDAVSPLMVLGILASVIARKARRHSTPAIPASTI